MIRGSSLKRSPLKRFGKAAREWQKFRNAKLAKDGTTEGYIWCQDYLIGLERCGRKSYNPDLHHVIGRNARPDLYYSDANLVWLVRECHQKVHDATL